MNSVMTKVAHIGTNSVILAVSTFVEEGLHVARCDALGISDHGTSEQDAVFNLGKTVALLFESCQRRGTTWEFLKQKGILPAGRLDDGSRKDGVFVPVLSWGRTDASSFGI